jgi:hypothetical protein
MVRKDKEWILVNPVAACWLSKTPSETECKVKSDLKQLQNVLENTRISKSEENTRKAVEIILSKQLFLST